MRRRRTGDEEKLIRDTMKWNDRKKLSTFWILIKRNGRNIWFFIFFSSDCCRDAFLKLSDNFSLNFSSMCRFAAPLCSGNEVDVLVMRENLQDLQKNKNFSSFSSVKLDRPKNIVTPEKWQNFHGKFISLSAACLVVLCTSAEHLQSRRAGSILFVLLAQVSANARRQMTFPELVCLISSGKAVALPLLEQFIFH